MNILVVAGEYKYETNVIPMHCRRKDESGNKLAAYLADKGHKVTLVTSNGCDTGKAHRILWRNHTGLGNLLINELTEKTYDYFIFSSILEFEPSERGADHAHLPDLAAIAKTIEFQGQIILVHFENGTKEEFRSQALHRRQNAGAHHLFVTLNRPPFGKSLEYYHGQWHDFRSDLLPQRIQAILTKEKRSNLIPFRRVAS